MGQGEVEAQGDPSHPGTGAAVGSALGWGSGLLDGHDALPTQDQAQPFHDPRAAVDGPLGRRLSATAKAGLRSPIRTPWTGTPNHDWVGRAGHGRHGGEAPALCVGTDDVGLEFLVLLFQDKRTDIYTPQP